MQTSQVAAVCAGLLALGCVQQREPVPHAPWTPRFLPSPAYTQPTVVASPVPYSNWVALPEPSVPGAPPPPLQASTPQSPDITYYSVLSGVVIPTRVEQKVAQVAKGYFRRTGNQLVITSGTRDSSKQASAMYDMLKLGTDIMKLYKNKPAAQEVKNAYDFGRATARAEREIVASMARVIQNQIQRGIFISAHLRSGAVDIRSRDMSAEHKKAFLEEAGDIEGITVWEESQPPHYHLQIE